MSNPVYLDNTKATAAVKQRCLELGYAVEKVDELEVLRCSTGKYGETYFAYFPDIESHGLCNDLETQAIPVFKVDRNYNVSIFSSAKAYFETGEKLKSISELVL